MLDDNEITPPPVEPPNTMGKILLVNCAILLGMNVLFRMTMSSGESMITFAFFIAAHVLFCLVAGIVLLIKSGQWRKYGFGMLLSSFFVLLVGFSACLFNMAR